MHTNTTAAFTQLPQKLALPLHERLYRTNQCQLLYYIDIFIFLYAILNDQKYFYTFIIIYLRTSYYEQKT